MLKTTKIKRHESFDINSFKNIKAEILKNEAIDMMNTSPKIKFMAKKTQEISHNITKMLDFGGENNEENINQNPTYFNLDNNTNQNRRLTKENYNKKFYCPFCEHCNNIKDANLDSYIYTIRESKNIINRGFDYIIHSNILSDLDIFKDNKKNGMSGQVDASTKFEV